MREEKKEKVKHYSSKKGFYEKLIEDLEFSDVAYKITILWVDKKRYPAFFVVVETDHQWQEVACESIDDVISLIDKIAEHNPTKNGYQFYD